MRETAAYPDYEGTDNCHESGAYMFVTPNATAFTVSRGARFELHVSGTGPGVVLKFLDAPSDNAQFTVTPAGIVEDGAARDESPMPDEVNVTYRVTAPETAGVYHLFLFARGPPTGGIPDLASVEFSVTVEQVRVRVVDHVFDHMNVYLGGAALACAVVAFVLIRRDLQHVKTHGILMLVALGLTTVNVVLVVPDSLAVLEALQYNHVETWVHFSHIVIGCVGCGAAVVALVQGYAGSRDKRAGYVTLACWGFNFVFGVIYWGVGL